MSQPLESPALNSEYSIEQVIELGLQTARSARSVTGADWMFVPDFEPLTEARIESRFAEDLPALAHLQAALELAQQQSTAALVSAFTEVLDQVRWSQNPAYIRDTIDPDFLDGYAYAGLAGPDCPVRCEVPRVGFLLMGPGVTYPNHKHGPREFYLVLTPGSHWKLDDGDWFAVEPGDLILHEPWQLHAMKTSAQPLLTLAGWLEQGNRQAIEL